MHRRTLLAACLAAPLFPLLSRAQTDHSAHGASAPPDHAAMGHAMPAAPAAGASPRPPAGAPLQAWSTLGAQASLRAAPGVLDWGNGLRSPSWGYNQPALGPLLEWQAGQPVQIDFANALPEASNMHWHGLDVPASEDGHPRDAVLAGGQRRYQFTVPDRAGLFWYHPHPHGRTAAQVAMGLAGPIRVRRHDEPLPVDGMDEQVLMITDQRLLADGQIAPHSDADWMDGREGDLLLVNGQYQPVLSVQAGQWLRLRLINACAARYLTLSLPGHAWVQIGTDGGYLATALPPVRVLQLVPGQRADVLVALDAAPGSRVVLQSLPYARGKMVSAEQSQPEALLSVQYRPQAAVKRPRLPARLADITPLPAPAIRREVVLSETMRMDGGKHQMAFLINQRSYDDMDRADFTGRVGQVEEWTVHNRSDMDHPFHLHGAAFQIRWRQAAGQRRRPEPWLGWHDVVNLRPGESLALRFVQQQAGDRLFHCHILEHEDQGMMATLRVVG